MPAMTTVPGMLTAAELHEEIANGAIDTVLVAFPDLQGRLVGKRVTGHYWAEQMQGGREPVHACNYLLAVDVDMNPLPGYQFANWEQGYGDVAVQPDLATHPPRSRGSRRPRSCCATSSTRTTGEPVEVSPRRILQRQVERAAALGYHGACSASELEFFLFRESVDEAAAKGYANLTPHSHVIEDYHILQTTRDEYVIRAIRNGDGRRGRARRVLEGRSRAGASTRSTSCTRRGRDGRPARDLQERREGDRVAARPVDHVHGEVLDRTRSARRATCTRACGTPTATTPLMWERRRARPPVAGVPRLARRPARVRPRARVDVRPDRQLLQALPARVVGADRARVERRQPHVRLPRRRARAVVPARVAHPRRRREPVPRVRGHDRGRPARHRARHRAAAALRRQRVRRRRRCARVPSSLVEAIDAFASVEGRGRRVRRRRARPPAQHRPPGVGRTSTARSPTGNAAATSTNGEPSPRVRSSRSPAAALGEYRPLAALGRDRVAARLPRRASRRAGALARRSIDPVGDPSGAPRPRRRARAHRRPRRRPGDLRRRTPHPKTYGVDRRRRRLRARARARRARPRAARRSRSAAASRCSTSRSAARCTSTSPSDPGVEPHGRPGEPDGGARARGRRSSRARCSPR